MSIIKLNAAAGLIVLAFASTVHASQQEYVRDYSYQAQSYDTKESARVQALDGVRSGLVDELGVYIQSVIKIEKDQLGNSYMSSDIVSLSAGVIAMNVLQEKWNKVDYYVKAKMRADPDEVLDSLKKLHY